MKKLIDKLEKLNDDIVREEYEILQLLRELHHVDRLIKERLKEKSKIKSEIERKWEKVYEMKKKEKDKITKDMAKVLAAQEIKEKTEKIDQEIRDLEDEQKELELKTRQHRIERDRAKRMWEMITFLKE